MSGCYTAVTDEAARVSAALLSRTPLKCPALGSAGALQLWGGRGAHPALRSRCQSAMDIQLSPQADTNSYGSKVLIVPVLGKGPVCLLGCRVTQPESCLLVSRDHRIVESLRLEKTSKIIKSNHQPNTTMPAKPCPEVPHLHVF